MERSGYGPAPRRRGHRRGVVAPREPGRARGRGRRVRDPGGLLGAHGARGGLRRARRGRRARLAHDAARGEGPRVRRGVPDRHGRGRLPPPAQPPRPLRARGGAAPLLRRGDPCEAPPRRQPRLDEEPLRHDDPRHPVTVPGRAARQPPRRRRPARCWRSSRGGRAGAWRTTPTRVASFGGGAPPVPRAPSTGAELLGLAAGDEVVHERWGRGTVLSIEGTGAQMRGRVRFAGVGEKQLLISMAPLRRPGDASTGDG